MKSTGFTGTGAVELMIHPLQTGTLQPASSRQRYDFTVLSNGESASSGKKILLSIFSRLSKNSACIMQIMRTKTASILTHSSLVLLLVFTTTAAISQTAVDGGPPGVSSESPGGEAGCSSAGSEGMPDTDAVYLGLVKKAEKSGLKSQTYIGSLIDLGMHYNRVGKHAQACTALTKALAIIDGGALKPRPAAQRKPDKIIEHHGDGVVGAELIHQPQPYEETLEALFPPLVDAEIATGKYPQAEIHLKRQINLATANGVSGQINLMTAYMQYANLCNKTNRKKEAAFYQKKADAINASFKPL